MSEYLPTIGLEIHAELSTASKMFCACRNDADEARPNVNICPICMAHPGTLPVINKEAVHKVLRVGAALGGTLADHTIFDRKNYFYPDIPKGYQISQYEHPLVSGGSLAGVAITRVHLEEDTARSSHGEGVSLVDFNRAGVPLMELVTEPVIHDYETAGVFARELQLLLRSLGVGNANMEKGEMRVEANVSVSKSSEYGTKVEVKNLNSFRAVERAIQYEIKRQIDLLESGGVVVQETRGWDENGQKTFAQRKKESSHDYRYFPEPDLPPLVLSEIPEFSIDILRSELPELPVQRRARYVALGLKEDDAAMFVRTPIYGDFFDAVIEHDKEVAVLAANYLGSDIAGKIEEGSLTEDWFTSANAGRFGALMRMAKDGKLSSRGTKDTLALMVESLDSPEKIAQENGLMQQSDSSLIAEIVKKVIENNSDVVGDYRSGKISVIQYLIGQGMKESKGSANPAVLKTEFERQLSN
ncbi:MAG TPA: Asp-tRNA(Asn)/Glu-tRNA(Gln) amidotransferase subunit GatB [Candidatus Paceibacterota bacterium]